MTIKRPNQDTEPLTAAWLFHYWDEFCRQCDPEYRNEFQFAQFLRERAEST
jgi:hypothetical protein